MLHTIHNVQVGLCVCACVHSVCVCLGVVCSINQCSHSAAQVILTTCSPSPQVQLSSITMAGWPDQSHALKLEEQSRLANQALKLAEQARKADQEVKQAEQARPTKAHKQRGQASRWASFQCQHYGRKCEGKASVRIKL